MENVNASNGQVLKFIALYYFILAIKTKETFSYLQKVTISIHIWIFFWKKKKIHIEKKPVRPGFYFIKKKKKKKHLEMPPLYGDGYNLRRIGQLPLYIIYT